MLIATPNLCLDITVSVPRLHPGTVTRATATDTSAGGKGVNVARAALALGAKPAVAGFLPSEDGRRFEAMLATEGLTLYPVSIPGVLRIASVLVESDGRVTVINGRGPEVTKDMWAQFTALVAEHAADADVLICSGSLPPGVPDDGYRQLVDIGHRAGVPVIVDAAPAVLREALKSAPDLISPNLSEAEGLLLGSLDEQVDDEGDDIADRAVRAAAALHDQGAVRAVVTAGAAGAALRTSAGTWWLPAEPVTVVNPIGAGDCFAAGAGLALAAGHADIDIVRRGMAAASASCETITAGRLAPGRAQQLFEAITAQRIVSPMAAR
jgi:1-phosphofructokinase family hexose kinase